MDFQIILFVSIIIGIMLVIFSLFVSSADPKSTPDNYLETSNIIKALESSVDEMNKTMEELDSASKAIFDEIDEKYQELLFLYALIDERKNELAQFYGKIPKESESAVVKTLNNPRLKEIVSLKEQGLSVSEIAKHLSMGQGEVKLILELGKVR